ncbi:MAG TPA: ParB/RepB/Spo0J family partition protein [Streptosporangiaceae bacterium]|nr:ParB/RepB/Spo0J family partition protein [Streptosporangiaceae bacterium]
MEYEAGRLRSNFSHATRGGAQIVSPLRQPQIVPISSLLPADSPRLLGIDEEHIRRLAEMETTLPPILVHRDTMRVIDGMHRLRAAILTGKREIQVEFFDGSEEEAFIQAVRANIVHGLPLTLADRRAAASRILSTHPHLSDRAIGSYTGLSDKTVSAIRSRSTSEITQLSRRVGADGRIRPLNSHEGRRRAAEVIAARPDASLREVAATAGISVGTAHDVRQRIRRGEDPIRNVDSKIGRPDTESAFSAAAEPPALEPVERRNPRPADNSEDIDTRAILNSLARDPSLKQTDAGRELLRWLHTHVVSTGDWDRLLAAVPPYRLKSLATLALLCGDVWHQFAQELECRERLAD